MLNAQTVYCVNMSDVLKAVYITPDNFDKFYSYLDGTSFGDALYTLTGNRYFLKSVLDYFHYECGYREEDLQKVDDIFWSVVPQNAYINLEA